MEKNNKKLSDKNYHFWFGLINIIILSLTMFFLILYTNYTREILNETNKSNQLAQLPFLDFWTEYDNPFIFENKGKGPALNIFILEGSKYGDFYISPETDILSALTVGRTSIIKKSNLVKIEKQKIVDKIPELSIFIDKVSKKENNWICLVYEDVFENKFYTINNGVGNKYDEIIEFGKIE